MFVIIFAEAQNVFVGFLKIIIEHYNWEFVARKCNRLLEDFWEMCIVYIWVLWREEERRNYKKDWAFEG